MDFPIEHGDFPVRYVSLPEGNYGHILYIYIYCILYVMNPLHQVVPECESMPRGCNALKWPWAVGSESVVFPPQVGRAWGLGSLGYGVP